MRKIVVVLLALIMVMSVMVGCEGGAPTPIPTPVVNKTPKPELEAGAFRYFPMNRYGYLFYNDRLRGDDYSYLSTVEFTDENAIQIHEYGPEIDRILVYIGSENDIQCYEVPVPEGGYPYRYNWIEMARENIADAWTFLQLPIENGTTWELPNGGTGTIVDIRDVQNIGARTVDCMRVEYVYGSGADLFKTARFFATDDYMNGLVRIEDYVEDNVKETWIELWREGEDRTTGEYDVPLYFDNGGSLVYETRNVTALTDTAPGEWLATALKVAPAGAASAAVLPEDVQINDLKYEIDDAGKGTSLTIDFNAAFNNISDEKLVKAIAATFGTIYGVSTVSITVDGTASGSFASVSVDVSGATELK